MIGQTEGPWPDAPLVQPDRNSPDPLRRYAAAAATRNAFVFDNPDARAAAEAWAEKQYRPGYPTRIQPEPQDDAPDEPRCARCGCTRIEHHKLHCDGRDGNCICHGGWLNPGEPLTALDHVGQAENAEYDSAEADRVLGSGG